MSGPRQQKSVYHQKALQQIRNSLQPFATSETGSSSSGISSNSSSNDYSKDFYRQTQSSSPSRHSPRGIEYRAQQYPFVPSQVPPSVQQLLRRIDSPSSPSSSSSNSPTSLVAPIVNKKPTLIIKSTVVPKPVLQTAVPYALPPPLPPKPKPKFTNNNNNNNYSNEEKISPPPRPDFPPLNNFPINNTSSNNNFGNNNSANNNNFPNSPNNNFGINNNNNFGINNNYGNNYPANNSFPTNNNGSSNPYNLKDKLNPPQSSTPPSPLSFDLVTSSHQQQQQQILAQLLQQQQHINNNSQVPHQPAPILQQAKVYQPDTNINKLTNNNNNCDNSSQTNITQSNNNNNNSNNNTNGTDRVRQPGPEPGGGNPSSGKPPEVTTHESPIPERKKLSREKEEERFESKVRVYSPQAFKFFMEQHVENVIKSHEERVNRRMQLEAEMAKIGLSEEAQEQVRRMLSQKESNYIRLKRAKMDKSMFKVIRTIGVGAFGEVALVRKLDTQHLYAMKTLRKSDVLRRNQVAHVKAERDILAEADNEWVVKLYYSFQDVDHLYFVMDYIPGGDLMSLLIKKGIFEEPLARFYIAELTCAVESVHKMGFIHRDIKPDNILIDRDGHIKLTDFGLCTGFRWTHNSKYYQDTGSCKCEQNCQWQACTSGEKPLVQRRKKEHIRCLAHSLVGTPNYISPEVLMRTGYTQLCDWWSVGVILYEMLVGQPPFLASTPAETQYKVINWASTLRIPSQAHLSSQAKDLILQLCTDSSRRLGKKGSHQVKSHPFFSPIDFKSGLRRTVAPFVPKIRHPTDTSNFDPCDGDKPEDTDSSPLHDNQFHGFFEFTFRRFFDDAAYNNEDGGPVYV